MKELKRTTYKKKKLIEYNGITFYKQKTGYYTKSMAGKPIKLHRYIYETETGKTIKSPYIVIFIDGNFDNLNINNLLLVTQNQNYKLINSGICVKPISAWKRVNGNTVEKVKKEVIKNKVFKTDWIKKPLKTQKDREDDEMFNDPEFPPLSSKKIINKKEKEIGPGYKKETTIFELA